MSKALASILSVQKLYEVLHLLSDCLDLPVRLLDAEGVETYATGKEPAYCGIIRKSVFRNGECEKTRDEAGRHAQKLGESYIFSCAANATCIVYPLLYHGNLLASVLIGPFIMDEPDSTLISDLAEQQQLAPSLSLSLYDELKHFRVIMPGRVGQFSRLIDAVLSPLLPTERMLLFERQEKLYQQSRINETVQALKEGDLLQNDSYPFEMEQELLRRVKTADLSAAKEILNKLLGHVLFSEGGNVDLVKERAIELCTLLSRVVIQTSGNTHGLYELNRAFISRLNALSTYDDVCFQLQEVVESFVSVVSEQMIYSDNKAVSKVVAYIGRHYMQPLSLDLLSKVAGLSSTYLSAQFTRVMGYGLREQINRVRVEEAKRLLTATDYSLSDIAVAIGFADQSYFSKVFKKETGLTPSQYRN